MIPGGWGSWNVIGWVLIFFAIICLLFAAVMAIFWGLQSVWQAFRSWCCRHGLHGLVIGVYDAGSGQDIFVCDRCGKKVSDADFCA